MGFIGGNRESYGNQQSTAKSACGGYGEHGISAARNFREQPQDQEVYAVVNVHYHSARSSAAHWRAYYDPHNNQFHFQGIFGERVATINTRNKEIEKLGY
jgi:hypothetical protein